MGEEGGGKERKVRIERKREGREGRRERER